MQQILILYAHFADFELLRRVRGGDKECYEVLIRRYTRLLYRIGRIFRLEADAAEAMAIAVFSAAYGRCKEMKEPRDFRTFLARAAIDHCKSLTQPGSDLYPSAEDDDNAQEVPVMLQTEKLNTLEKAIDALPLSLKAPVVLCALESYTTEEAASLLGLSQPVIETRLRLANLRLRGRLLKWYQEEDIFSCDNACTDRIAASIMELI